MADLRAIRSIERNVVPVICIKLTKMHARCMVSYHVNKSPLEYLLIKLSNQFHEKQ